MQTSSTAAITKQICWKQFPNETVSKTLMHLFRRLLRSPYSPCISCWYSKLIECYQSLINGKQWNSQHNSTLRAIALLSVYVCWSSRCEKSVSILSHHTIGCSYVAMSYLFFFRCLSRFDLFAHDTWMHLKFSPYSFLSQPGLMLFGCCCCYFQ